MSGVPQGSNLGPVVFNIFTDDTDSGTECSFSKTAYYTKLCGTADTMEEQAAIHREQDELENCAHKNLMKSNRSRQSPT